MAAKPGQWTGDPAKNIRNGRNVERQDREWNNKRNGWRSGSAKEGSEEETKVVGHMTRREESWKKSELVASGKTKSKRMIRKELDGLSLRT